jgi:hypothetical protein
MAKISNLIARIASDCPVLYLHAVNSHGFIGGTAVVY